MSFKKITNSSSLRFLGSNCSFIDECGKLSFNSLIKILFLEKDLDVIAILMILEILIYHVKGFDIIYFMNIK
jgi:hypothetical protein